MNLYSTTIGFSLMLLAMAVGCTHSDNDTTDAPTGSRVKEFIRYNSMGQPFLRVRYDYNDLGLLEREVYWDSSSMGIRTRQKVYFYDDSLKKQVEFRSADGIIYEGKFLHDSLGRVIREEYYNDGLYRWVEYEYNEKNNITRQTNWERGAGYRILKYSYKDGEHIDTIWSMDTAGNILQTDIYTYQNDTLLDRLIMIQAGGDTLATWKYQYNDKGQLVEETELGENGNQYVLKKYIYNQQCKVIQEESMSYNFYTRRFEYDSTGTILLEERSYDKMGNLTYRNIYEPVP